jgi:hypothetical protein
MICTKCFEAESVTSKTKILDRGIVLTVECDKCPKCGDITFTHEQSLEVDRKRREAEFERSMMDIVLWTG